VDGGTKLFEKSTLAFEPGVTEEGDALLVSIVVSIVDGVP